MVRKIINHQQGLAKPRVYYHTFRMRLLHLFEVGHPLPILFVLPDFRKELQLVERRVCMIVFASLDFESIVLFVDFVLDEPDSGEMAPP